MGKFQAIFYSYFFQEWNLRVGILIFLGLNAFANVYNIISVGPNGNCSDLPAVQKQGYRFCYQCQLNEPPRSHHCPGDFGVINHIAVNKAPMNLIAAVLLKCGLVKLLLTSSRWNGCMTCERIFGCYEILIV